MKLSLRQGHVQVALRAPFTLSRVLELGGDEYVCGASVWGVLVSRSALSLAIESPDDAVDPDCRTSRPAVESFFSLYSLRASLRFSSASLRYVAEMSLIRIARLAYPRASA